MFYDNWSYDLFPARETILFKKFASINTYPHMLQKWKSTQLHESIEGPVEDGIQYY